MTPEIILAIAKNDFLGQINVILCTTMISSHFLGISRKLSGLKSFNVATSGFILGFGFSGLFSHDCMGYYHAFSS